jgi:LemA protein
VLTAVVIVVAVIVAAFLYGYNRLVRLRNRAQAAWHDIDVYLRRRHDLIPNLVETVKAYAEHERGVFETVTELRTTAVRTEQQGRPDEIAETEAQLTDAVQRLFAVAEAYPDLKADARFRDLQLELAATENKIAFSRQLYNDTVEAYRRATEQIPLVLIAKPFGFEPPAFFAASQEERHAPRVGE